MIIATSQESVADHEVFVSHTPGSSVPGCEVFDECFLPSIVFVDDGGTVTWLNDDSGAHTVTSGESAIPEEVGDFFDSSLILAGDPFSWIAGPPGEYPYFCLVHPWMEGLVVVNSVLVVGGASIPIDTTALLVAGSQMMSPWLIIGGISVVGIGLAVFTLKRR